MVAASRDITTAKRHEEHIQILMKEVSHRAKNMLGVVQAIARKTATSTTIEEFTKRFSERVNSLAASHDLLVDGDWQGVDLGTLVRSQLRPFRDLIDTHFKLKGPALRVSAAAAQSIGMAIHELATNAAKYGALSDNTGCVEIDWDLETAEAGDTFVMSWRERDGPPVTAPSRRGFGSTVINDVVKMSLSADVELEFAPTGVLWRIACPAEGVLDI